MMIRISIDIEEAVRDALAEYMTAYCRPLPANYDLPCILVQETGGDSVSNSAGIGKLDRFVVTLDARAKNEDEALKCLRSAIGILEATRSAGISHVEVNSLYSWGVDPVRPDIAMCSATLVCTAHRKIVSI